MSNETALFFAALTGSARRHIRVFQIHQFLDRFAIGLIVAVIALALTDRGMDLFQISVLFGVYSLTTLAMDIAVFTGFSARHEPEFVVETLDKLLSDATRTVSDRGGVVLSYLGDGFLATFNTPASIDNPEDAALAIATDLVQVAKANGFDIRVGIASGDLVTGIVGNETRQTFTVYGNAVNLASRLESLGKKPGRTIVVD